MSHFSSKKIIQPSSVTPSATSPSPSTNVGMDGSCNTTTGLDSITSPLFSYVMFILEKGMDFNQDLIVYAKSSKEKTLFSIILLLSMLFGLSWYIVKVWKII